MIFNIFYKTISIYLPEAHTFFRSSLRINVHDNTYNVFNCPQLTSKSKCIAEWFSPNFTQSSGSRYEHSKQYISGRTLSFTLFPLLGIFIYDEDFERWATYYYLMGPYCGQTSLADFNHFGINLTATTSNRTIVIYTFMVTKVCLFNGRSRLREQHITVLVW